MKQKEYDAIIVGSGIAGSIIALELGKAGRKVLILEAGPETSPARQEYLDRYYNSSAKIPSSPYPPEYLPGQTDFPDITNAGRATVILQGGSKWNDPTVNYWDQKGYVVDGKQEGAPFQSTYQRVGGGTTMHWMGECPRLLPHDFEMHKRYGRGKNWPLSYDELMTDYEKAEKEIGVSGEIEDPDYGQAVQNQERLKLVGLKFRKGYRYPMRRLEPSYLDKFLAGQINGMKIRGFKNPAYVSSTPAGRNSENYDNREACQGNTSCVPICPIRAKYDANVTLDKALATGNVDIQYKTVVDRIKSDANGKIQNVHWIRYEKERRGTVQTGKSKAKLYVVAAHAIETPKLLLNSRDENFENGLANSSDQVGRNLMDHPDYLGWGLTPEPVFPFRGPVSTSSIDTLRDGEFRREHAAFRIVIGNQGWSWATNDPYSSIYNMIQAADQPLHGVALQQALKDKLSRQIYFNYLIEQLPDPKNRVTLSDYRDGLSIRRPQIHYRLDDYTKLGFVKAQMATQAIFNRSGIEDYTKYDPSVPTYFQTKYRGETFGFQFWGAGHIMGTTCMGHSSDKSVVNSHQQSWDHKNLFIVGAGSFTTTGTANPTLTVAALSYRSSREILKVLARS